MVERHLEMAQPTKKSSIFYQILNEPFQNGQSFVTFYQRGEISPNLVTLVMALTDGATRYNQEITMTSPRYHSTYEIEKLLLCVFNCEKNEFLIRDFCFAS